MTLGRFGAISVEHARQLALRALAGVADGHDPAKERHEIHVTPTNTLAAVAAEYVKRHGRTLRPRTLAETKRVLSVEVLPTLGNRPIQEIRRRDLLALHDKIVDRGHDAAANKVISVLKSLLSWAVTRDHIEHSPAVGIRIAKNAPRSRVLDDAELRAVWEAALRMGWPFGPFIQLLMLTAARRNEVAEMEWRELSDDRTTWTLPPERSKTANGRVILLPVAGVDIIRDLPQLSDRWVLTFNGRRPISAFDNCKERIDKLSGVSGWTFHDLRRTAATRLGEMGFAPHIIEAVLGHAPIKGIAAVYNVHRYPEECRVALEAWSAHLRGVSPAGNVTRIASQRRRRGAKVA
jgi:integrase